MKINIDMIKNEYLGDAVYANEGRFPGEVVLTTGHHFDVNELTAPDNIIFLDPSVAKELYRYLKNIFEV